MTDPQTPDAQQPTPSAAPAYQQPAAPAYQQPAYTAAPSYADSAPAPGTPVPGKTLGIVAFVLSFFIQLVALILGIVALVQSRKVGRGNGFAVAAIIISVVLMILGAILFFAFVVPTINAATTCVNDPTAIVTVWGVEVPCEQVLEQSGR